MLAFYNEHHAQHRGKHEMFRGALVPAFEKPERADMVVAEFGRRGLGQIVTPHGVPLMSLEKIHTPRYLHFLRNAWSDWLALDPDNAARDAFPSVWPIRSLRDDIEPDNFSARMGLYSMDSGTPLTAGTWIAAKTGADCAVNAAHALRLGERSSFALTRPATTPAPIFLAATVVSTTLRWRPSICSMTAPIKSAFSISTTTTATAPRAFFIIAMTCCSPPSTPTRTRSFPFIWATPMKREQARAPALI